MLDPDAPTRPPLSLFCAPYHDLLPVKSLDALEALPRLARGAAVLWELERGEWGSAFRTVRDRPPGVALILVLPPASTLESLDALLEAAEQCRPHSILPYHPHPAPEDLAAVLRRTPEDLPMVFMDYLLWRGVSLDLETRRIVRRTVTLSGELRSVSAVARALYMSRRALGRRFRSRGLPVPSHLLHFARVLRAALALQASSRTLFQIGCDLGYPDGFALSNQMMRLTGLRPSTVRKRLGWEWLVEAWLVREAADGKIHLPADAQGKLRSLSAIRELGRESSEPPGPRWRRSPSVAERPS